ncbi:NUDIX domain-containing protein [Oscillibacter sp.]|uniref:(deoxy)nucleoside triphosphate pyrophosphohydrolase n=1 Tax=Oscillibacter sp. TaxID=1945593 RepID=UPI0033931DDD
MEVTAAVIRVGNKILLMRRALGHNFAGGWEYPGGKVEPNETGQECIQRELLEELGIVANIGPLIATYLDSKMRLRAYLVTSYFGSITLSVHDAMHWVEISQLLDHDQLPADREVSKQVLEKLI